MLEIDCAGERLVLLNEKAISWPRTESVIVSDLHFGKPAAFRAAGIAVPEATTAFDLERLDKIIGETRSSRLIILGDFFHAPAGRQAQMMDAVGDWCGRNSKLEVILVPGNHDKKSGEPPECWNIRSVPDGWSSPPFAYCHEPKNVAGHYVLCGHIHPAILLREKFGGGVRVPCFCFGKHRAILPAFGSFTGMSPIKPCAGERIFAVAQNAVIEVTSRAGGA